MLLYSFLYLHELIAKVCKFEMLEFDGKVVLYAEVDLTIRSNVYEIDLVFIGEEDKYVVMRVIMEV